MTKLTDAIIEALRIVILLCFIGYLLLSFISSGGVMGAPLEFQALMIILLILGGAILSSFLLDYDDSSLDDY